MLLALAILSCRKNNADPAIDNIPDLSLDSLKTLSTNIPNASYADLTFINETIGFAIADGLIVKTADGGATWTSVIPPINTPLRKIQFTDNQNGYIIGGDHTFGVLLKTSDGGQTWSVINLNTLECPIGMYFLNSSTGFITGKNLFSRTTDGGQTWTSIRNSPFKIYLDVSFKNSTEGIATASNGVYFKTSNGGASWDSVQSPNNSFLYNVYFTDTKTLITKSDDTLMDIDHNDAVTRKPYSAHKLLFLSSRKCIGIGGHYNKLGYFPYGDIFITNDGWTSFSQKTFSTDDAIGFGAIARMTENKIMILGNGFSGTTVILLKI